MPAARDLTGQTFGLLTVIRSDGRVFWGQDQAAWLCRCACGAELRVPQKRLTTASLRHQQHACDVCRAVPCEICQTPVPVGAHAKTCSPECRAERESRFQLDYYHTVRASDPVETAKRRARARARWEAMTPEEKLAEGRRRKASEAPEIIQARARRRHQERIATEPDYAARKEAERTTHRARIGPEAVREYQRNSARRRQAARTEIDMLRAVDTLRRDTDE